MEQIQMAKLSLQTNKLTLNTSSYKGQVDQFRTNITWNNVNFRMLLGDMYDKYDLFNLKLVNIVSDSSVPVAGVFESDRIVNLNMRGLNFVNQGYDSNININRSSSIIGSHHFYNSFNRDINSITTFAKGSDFCNLNIYYSTIDNDDSPSTTTEFPQVTFNFYIYGIPKTDNK